MPLQTQITHKLKSLTPHTVPLFGKMTAQHMVEHLMYSVMFSNGKWPQKLYFSPEKANIIKQNLIYSNMEMPVGFKAPMLGEELPELRFPNLDDAIAALILELEGFYKYFDENPDAMPINPTMGEMNKAEWIVFHTKHFTHHFKQFGL